MASFGKTTAGSSSSASSTTKIAASQATPTSSGKITSGHFHLWVTSGSCSAALLLYADNSGAPGALLASSNSITVTQTSDAAVNNVTFSGANQVTVTAGTPYWIGVEWSDPGTPSVNIGRDSTANGRLEVQGFTFGSPPDPFGTGTALSGPIAAYIDYAIIGTAAAPLGGLAATALGTRTTFGTAAAPLGFTATATGHNSTVRGTAAAALGGLAASAVTMVLGTGTATLGALTAAAHGVDVTTRPIPAIYPSDSLYPSDTLFPSDGTVPGIANPNWPVVGVEVDFSAGPPNTPGVKRRSINAAYRRLTVRGFSVDRGRQYELDQIQAGTCTMDIPDPLEMLNPDNPVSPFNSGKDALDVTPYRAMWVWAMWPTQPGSGNIINPGVAARYDSSFEGGTGLWAPADVSTALAQTTVRAWTGSRSLAVTQGAAGHSYGIVNYFRTSPGLTYTFSAYVSPTGGAAVRVRVVDAQGGVTLSDPAAVQDTWQRVAVTWTAVDTLEAITIYATGPTAPIFYVDGTQLEFGTSPTPWQSTGPTLYPIFTGYVERYPTAYDMDGTRALHPLEAVDALAILSRVEIGISYDAEVLADKPILRFPLNNTAPPASTDLLGPGFGAGGRANFIVSANGQINWGGDTNPDGTPAVVFTAQNPNDPPTLFPAGSFTEMAALGGAVSLDSVNGFMVEVWAKWTSGTAQVGTLELIQVGDPRGLNTNVPAIGWASFNYNQLNPFYNDTGSNHHLIAAGPPPDSQWHHMVIGVRGTGVETFLDGVFLGTLTGIWAPVGHLGLNTFYMEASSQYAVPQAQVTSSRFAVYSGVLSPARVKAHYDRGVGFVGETSGNRATRLLQKYWGGPTTVYQGKLPLSSDLGYDKRTVLDVMQEIQESERGLIYADRLGTVIVEDRTARYRNQTALWVFGENPPGAVPVEYPYTSYKTDHDPTYVFTEFDLSRPGNTAYPPIVNTAAELKYGHRVAQQELKVTRDFDLDQAGIFYEQRYAAPKTRITTLTLNPAANPALWPVVLSLEISQRIRVTRRSAFLFSAEYYVEKISHKVDASNGSWTVDLQCSPVFVPQAWVLGDATLGVLGSTTTPVY